MYTADIAYGIESMKMLMKKMMCKRIVYHTIHVYIYINTQFN